MQGQGVDTRSWNALEAKRAAEKFGEYAKPQSKPIARVALTTSTGKPLRPGQHRFPSRADGVTNWHRVPVQ